MTHSGGVNNKGVIFEWDPVSNTYTKEYDFDGENGSNPYGDLAAKDGKLYGMTSASGANNLGVIFEWNPNSNTYSKQYDFDFASRGLPYGSLLLTDGKFYGMTFGIQPAFARNGGLFEWDPGTNKFTTKYHFGELDGNPRGNLLFHDGKLYGLANSEYRTKGMYWANLFEFDLVTNAYTNKYTFTIRTNTDNTYNGQFPFGSLMLSNEKIYGMTSSGGGSGNGVIFEWDPATNVYTRKISLKAQESGSSPNSLVFQQNHLYGITKTGGFDGLGSIFEWDFIGKRIVKKHDFDGVTGLEQYSANSRYPTGQMTFFNGKFYGLSYYMLPGGPHPQSHVFEWNPITNGYMQKLFFGSYGNTGSFTWKHDNLYALINWTSTNMTIFKYNPVTTIATTTVGYNYTEGVGLVERGEKLYGLGMGGINNAGIIFEFDITATTSSTKYDFVPATGSSPIGTMVLFNDKFYGMTDAGGANNKGVIFEWDAVSSIYTKKYDFNSADGGNPVSSLVLNNGKLYGMTRNGGSLNLGTIFEWDPLTNIYSKKSDFTGANGRNPLNKNALTVVPARAARGIPNSCITYSPIFINNSNNNNWVPIIDDNGYAVSEIKANGNNLGIVNASVFINDNPIREDGDRRLYLDRNITITPQFQPSSPVDIRLYIRGTEFETIKNAVNSIGAPSNIEAINELGIFKNDDDCGSYLIRSARPVATTGATWETDYVLSASVSNFSTFYFANKANVALPLTLLEFSGRLQSNKALLNWKTENEKNTLEFIVERSIDGNQYKPVGTVAAANRPGMHGYSFTDPAINMIGAKIIYYRLQQKDIDGQFVYSKIITLSLANENMVVSLYPNPVNNELNLSISSPQRDNIQLKIIDASGKMINQQTKQLTTGSNSLTIDVNKIATGVYYLSIQGNGVNKWMQFVKE